MSKRIKFFILIVAICAALSITPAANAAAITVNCSNGYTVTKDCGEGYLTVDCVNGTWSCSSC